MPMVCHPHEATRGQLVDDLVKESEAHDEGEGDPTSEIVLSERQWTGLNA